MAGDKESICWTSFYIVFFTFFNTTFIIKYRPHTVTLHLSQNLWKWVKYMYVNFIFVSVIYCDSKVSNSINIGYNFWLLYFEWLWNKWELDHHENKWIPVHGTVPATLLFTMLSYRIVYQSYHYRGCTLSYRAWIQSYHLSCK